MRRALVLLAFLVVPTSPALAGDTMGGDSAVPIYNAAFAAPHVAVLAGDSVTWNNVSVRTHTVTAVDGSFGSGPIYASASFTHRFDAPGVYPYYCTLHPGMRGDVTAYRVLLDPVTQPAAPGKPYTLSGRAALPQGSTVAIEAGGAVAATTTVDPNGGFTASVAPSATTTYAAVADGATSPSVQVLVLDRKVRATQRVRGRRIVIDATVTPASKGATVVLQLKLKERFGWWPVRVAKVGASSTARFSIPRGRKVQARVLLTASDAATELARSATFRLR